MGRGQKRTPRNGGRPFFSCFFAPTQKTPPHFHLQVLKIEEKGDEFTYYVRYVDWPGHDAWVEHADMRCYDERTLSRHGVPTVPPGRSGAVLVALPQPDWAASVADAVEADWESELIAAAKRRKKRRDPPPPQPPTHVDVRLTPELAQVLVEDDAVLAGVGEDGDGMSEAAATRLAPLPHHPTVDDVLQRYVDGSAGARATQKLSFEELVSGAKGEAFCARLSTPCHTAHPLPFLSQLSESLRDYFDKALPRLLLYPCESLLAASAAAAGTAPGAVWGARHLLRMVYLLPTLVPRLVGATGPEAASYARAGGHLRHFVEWMADHREWLFEGAPLGDAAGGDDADDDRVTTSSASGSRGGPAARSRSRTPVKRARGDSFGVPAAKQPTPPPPPSPPAAGGGIAAAAIAAAMAEANGE